MPYGSYMLYETAQVLTSWVQRKFF